MSRIKWVLLVLLLFALAWSVIGCSVSSRQRSSHRHSMTMPTTAPTFPSNSNANVDPNPTPAVAPMTTAPESAPTATAPEPTPLVAPIASPTPTVVSSLPEVTITERQPKTLKVTSPTNRASIPQMVCNVSGDAPGYPDGTILKLYVQTRWNVVYGQDSHPPVENGVFSGFVYLGNIRGDGIGEQFKVWVEDPSGQRSNIVTVTRTR